MYITTKISWNQNSKTASITGSSITPIKYFAFPLYSRRHSLPNGNGCIVVPLKETNTTTTTDSSRHEDEEDDDIDEEISETAALTAA